MHAKVIFKITINNIIFENKKYCIRLQLDKAKPHELFGQPYINIVPLSKTRKFTEDVIFFWFCLQFRRSWSFVQQGSPMVGPQRVRSPCLLRHSSSTSSSDPRHRAAGWRELLSLQSRLQEFAYQKFSDTITCYWWVPMFMFCLLKTHLSLKTINSVWYIFLNYITYLIIFHL